MEKGIVDFLIPVAERGGVENVTIKTTAYLQNCGWKVRVVQLVWEGKHWLPENIEYHPLSFGRGTYDINEFIDNYKSFLIENGTPDIAFGVGWPYSNYIIKQAAYAISKPILTISWLHSTLKAYCEAGFGDFDALNQADIHFAIGPQLKNEISVNPDCKPVIMVNNPVDFSALPKVPRTKSDISKNLHYVGRINSEKRVDIIIQALSMSKSNWTLHIWGCGNLENENMISDLIKRLKVENQITFHGWKDNPWKEIESADASVIASDFEASPLSAIESLQCGIPVITTPVGNLPFIIKPGENGYFFSNNSPAELAEILDAIVSGILPEISPQNCQKSVQIFEASKVLSDFEHILSDIYGVYQGN